MIGSFGHSVTTITNGDILLGALIVVGIAWLIYLLVNEI